jgi:glycine oxidase
MNDFIIVGRGLAACVMAHSFYREGISFKIIGDDKLSSCSRIAGGVWNPIVFKRLTKSWLADDVIPFLREFYAGCEATLGKKLVTDRDIIRPFSEEQERKLWQKKAVNELADYLQAKICETPPRALSCFKINNGYGIVKGGGSLDMPLFLDSTIDFFNAAYIDEVFDHSLLKLTSNGVAYRSVEARRIVFCEGFRVSGNPFFNWVPLKPAKGEMLTLSSETAALDNSVFVKNGFMMDIGEHLFKAGATYNWTDRSQDPTAEGIREIKEKIAEMTACEYKIVKHEAGIRPSAIDRRPVIGQHPEHQQLYIFNGLGTKGVMLAPYFVGKFVNFSVHQAPLNSEVNVKRFYHLYGGNKEAQN